MNMIQLRNGPLVREDAVLLALNLEDAGHTLTAKQGKLLVSEGSRLSEGVRRAIQAVRLHLLAIAAYEPPEPR